MEFKCINKKCGKVFRPHIFIEFKHPSLARCPECDLKGIKTELGTAVFKEMHAEINKAKGR